MKPVAAMGYTELYQRRENSSNQIQFPRDYETLQKARKWTKSRRFHVYCAALLLTSCKDPSLAQLNLAILHEHFFAVPYSNCKTGRAVAKAVSRWLPTVVARVRVRTGRWGLWWTKRHWGRFFPSHSISSAKSSFHHFLHHHNHPGLAQ
jgi:hypothetical protein